MRASLMPVPQTHGWNAAKVNNRMLRTEGVVVRVPLHTRVVKWCPKRPRPVHVAQPRVPPSEAPDP